MKPVPTEVPPTHPALRSSVLVNPLGVLVAMSLFLGVMLLLEAFLVSPSGYPWRGGRPAWLLGAGLLTLGLAGYATWRSNRPRLLTLTRASLRLEPLGDNGAAAAETIPLSSIVAYKYWLRVLRLQVFVQYHLRLELADGRVLHLADRPGTRPTDPAGAVRLDAVVKRLARWVPPGTRVRQLFFLTRTARVLLWLSGALVMMAGLLLWAGYPAGSLLLFPAVIYGASYYLGRGVAEITAK
ncbi:hypothetical protein [Hymenobacter psoromatis]|uniref:hypothetical protein n=1 Tax=Hymenobacter psoromatis TaxID=1484116 RepID=UPI001CBAAD88|nr:hypothetical protein [Hymenobacter psoromatis]